MSNREQLLNLVQKRHDRESFKQQHWEGSFFEYLEIVHQNPAGSHATPSSASTT
jgi:hypothetical protein